MQSGKIRTKNFRMRMEWCRNFITDARVSEFKNFSQHNTYIKLYSDLSGILLANLVNITYSCITSWKLNKCYSTMSTRRNFSRGGGNIWGVPKICEGGPLIFFKEQL